MKKGIALLCVVMVVLAAGCASGQTVKEAKAVTITAKQAKERLDREAGIILLDVRTKEEYQAQHIPNAILLPIDDIGTKAASVIPDKNATYFVYCRTGNRSATASAQLVSMGYKNVFDLGGIIDWTYGTVSGP